MPRSNHTAHRDARASRFRSGSLPGSEADVLAPGECAALTRAVLRTNTTGPTPALTRTLEWARSVRLHALILDSVLEGKVDIVLSQDGSDLLFREHAAHNIIPLPARR